MNLNKEKAVGRNRINSLVAIASLAAVLFLVASPELLTAAAYSKAPSLTVVKDYDSWAGYGVIYSSISGIETNVTVPKVICTGPVSDSNFSIGISDIGQNEPVAGVYAFCTGGRVTYDGFWCSGAGCGYTPWAPVQGDLVFMQINSTGTVNITDITKPYYSTIGAVKIVGNPNFAICGTQMESPYPQVNYKVVSFTDCKVSVAANGWKPIGGYGTATLYEYVCYNGASTSILSTPKALKSGMNFKVQFVNAGP